MKLSTLGEIFDKVGPVSRVNIYPYANDCLSVIRYVLRVLVTIQRDVEVVFCAEFSSPYDSMKYAVCQLGYRPTGYD